MSRGVFGFASALFVGALVACSGGAGTPDQTRGPDGVPPSSTDTPGNGREGPGTPGEAPGTPGESPGGSTNDSTSTCIACSGTYACTAPSTQNSGTSFVTLASATDGCGTLDDQGHPNGLLQCGGEFFDVENGQPVLVGTWSGGTGHFTVTGTVDGQTIVVDCVLSNNPQPQPQPGGTTDTVDAG